MLEALEASGAYRATSLQTPWGADADSSDTLGDVIGHEEHGFALAEDRATLEHVMRVITPREREVLRLRFAEDLTQAEIGERIGISQMQVSRIIRQALGRLRAYATADDGAHSHASGSVGRSPAEHHRAPLLADELISGKHPRVGGVRSSASNAVRRDRRPRRWRVDRRIAPARCRREPEVCVFFVPPDARATAAMLRQEIVGRPRRRGLLRDCARDAPDNCDEHTPSPSVPAAGVRALARLCAFVHTGRVLVCAAAVGGD